MGKNGLSNYTKLKKLRDDISISNIKLQIEKQRLQGDLQKLKASRIEKEAFIAKNYGYVKRQDYIYRFEKVPTQYDFRKVTARRQDETGKKRQ